MLYSRLFKKTKTLDKNLERNLLFAPNYLINTEEVGDGTRYTMGGHSIIIIQKTKNGKSLYFERTRTSKSNKLTIDPLNQIHLGFQSVNEAHYLIIGVRKNLSDFKPGDQISFQFKDELKLDFTLKAPEDKFKDNKNYACNLRIQLSLEELEHFKTKMLRSYKFTSNTQDKTVEENFDKEFRQKFREVVQSYAFCLNQYYSAR